MVDVIHITFLFFLPVRNKLISLQTNWNFFCSLKGNHESRIYVSDISQLYAVYDPANTGSKIVYPGTYILDPNHSNAGRIELLENMELQGQPGHPEKVIIDASLFQPLLFNPPLIFYCRTGAIRMGEAPIQLNG